MRSRALLAAAGEQVDLDHVQRAQAAGDFELGLSIQIAWVAEPELAPEPDLEPVVEPARLALP